MKRINRHKSDNKDQDNIEPTCLDSYYQDLVDEELRKVKYSSPIKTLKDMTEEEIASIEKMYNCKVRR